MAKISVIVPVYKVEKYLKRCVDSILHQTFKDIEVILVDDGSPDNCPKLCDEFAEHDNRIKVIHKQNGGVSSARNSGLDVASGQYIVFVDSDDQIQTDYLECLYAVVKTDDSDVCCCGYTYVGSSTYLHNDYYENKANNSKSSFLLKLFDKTGGTVWCKIYKSQVITQHNIRFEQSLNMCEDQLFNLNVFLCATRFNSIDYYGYLYNGITDGLSDSMNYGKWYEQLVVIKRIEFLMEKFLIKPKIVSRCIELKFRNTVFNLIFACIKEGRDIKLILKDNEIKERLKKTKIRDRFSVKYIMPLKLGNRKMIYKVYKSII